MPVNTHQTSFVAGELDPTMFGRDNLASYANAAAKIRNCYVRPQGSVPRREGMQYIDTVTNSDVSRSISFEFNTVQVYLIVLTPGEMKVYKNDVLVCTLATSPIDALTANMLVDINWVQSADTLILVHYDLQPIKITRTSDTAWTAVSISFTNVSTFDYGTGAEPMISAARGWARSVAFKYGRFWLGGLGSRPQTLIGSKTGDYFNLDAGTGQDNEAIYITLDDDRVNTIVNIFPGRALQIFTTGGEFAIDQGSLNNPVTPGNMPGQLKKATLHGCNAARPVSVDGSTLFVEANGSVVREFVYNDVESSYNAPNISLLASHLVVNPTRIALRQATRNLAADYVFMVNSDGTLAVLNVLRSESLLAWSLFTTDGFYEDLAVVGSSIYFIVRRVINGNNVRFIEKFNWDLKLDAAKVVEASVVVTGRTEYDYSEGERVQRLGSNYIELALDAVGVVETLSSETEWTGFDYLEGMVVKVFGDNYMLDNAVVNHGALVSSEVVQSVEVGLSFLAKVELLPVSISIAGRTWVGEYKRLAWVNIRLINSRGVVVEQVNGTVYKSAWRQFGASVLNTAVKLFSGWKKVYCSGYNRDTALTITQDDPLEFHLQSVVLGIGV